jgi:hypothetical protein
MAIKSAWELALERSGGNLKPLSEEQQRQLESIEREYKAKLAEIDLAYQEKMQRATAPDVLHQLQEDKAVELASARSAAERRKEEVRNR